MALIEGKFGLFDLDANPCRVECKNCHKMFIPEKGLDESEKPDLNAVYYCSYECYCD